MSPTTHTDEVVRCACGCKYWDEAQCQSCRAAMPGSDAYNETVRLLAEHVTTQAAGEIGATVAQFLQFFAKHDEVMQPTFVKDNVERNLEGWLGAEGDEFDLLLYGFGFARIHWTGGLRAALVDAVTARWAANA